MLVNFVEDLYLYMCIVFHVHNFGHKFCSRSCFKINGVTGVDNDYLIWIGGHLLKTMFDCS